jgi:hypothetical protein
LSRSSSKIQCPVFHENFVPAFNSLLNHGSQVNKKRCSGV